MQMLGTVGLYPPASPLLVSLLDTRRMGMEVSRVLLLPVLLAPQNPMVRKVFLPKLASMGSMYLRILLIRRTMSNKQMNGEFI
jgi:hypothetical protein